MCYFALVFLCHFLTFLDILNASDMYQIEKAAQLSIVIFHDNLSKCGCSKYILYGRFRVVRRRSDREPSRIPVKQLGRASERNRLIKEACSRQLEEKCT